MRSPPLDSLTPRYESFKSLSKRSFDRLNETPVTNLAPFLEARPLCYPRITVSHLPQLICDRHTLNPIQGGMKSMKNLVVKLELNLQLESDGHRMATAVTSIYEERGK
jgi:hypothetical protein